MEKNGLLSVKRCMEVIWPDEASRPSESWFRGLYQKRKIPFYQIEGSVFFKEDEVRIAIEKRFKQSAVQ